MKDTLKIFELLSQKIRFDIITQLNISRMSFSDLLAKPCFKGIRSNKFSFHLKRLVVSELIRKEANMYELTEFGLTTLKFVEAYKSDQEYYYSVFGANTEIESIPKVELSDQVPSITLPNRPTDLPPSVRTFDFFVGKNASFMRENYFLILPDPIDLSLHPQQWITTFIRNFESLLEEDRSKAWVKDRLLKLAFGTRGLQDFCLMDASLAVPPPSSLFNDLTNLLLNRGKAGLFGTTGMGKSRIILYLASWWSRKFQTPVLFIDNPSDIDKTEWKKLREILNSNIPQTRENPRWLIIIEDLHLVSIETLVFIKRLVSDAGIESWSVVVAFTNSIIHKHHSLTPNGHELKSSLEFLRNELQPLEISEKFDLNKIWPNWRDYFGEWIKWTSLDILIDLIPWKETVYESKSLTKFESPWSLVVSIGFLKASLSNLQKRSTDTVFPLLLYGLLSYLYIIREEQNITESDLCSFLKQTLNDDLINIYPKANWWEEVQNLIIDWTDPSIRLLPPIKYQEIADSLKKEIEITFYHQEWAREVCNMLLNPKVKDLHDIIIRVLKDQIPNLFLLWEQIDHQEKKFQDDFRYWLQENTRFQLTASGELVLIYLKLNKNEIHALDESSLIEGNLHNLTKIQLLNWAFIKKIVADSRTYT